MRGTSPAWNRDGSAMVISLLVLMALTALGSVMLLSTQTETQIAGHDMRSTQALFNAEAGYGEVLARTSDERDVVNYIGPPVGSWLTQPGWGRYLVLANGNSVGDPNRLVTAGDNLDNDGDTVIDEALEVYPEVLTKQTGEIINYPWVKVHYKLNGLGQAILYGDHDKNAATPPQPNVDRGFPLLVVTTEGGQGNAERTLEVEAVKVPVTVYNTALYAEDDDFQFAGTQFLVSGEDYDPVTGLPVAGATPVPGMITTGNPANIEGSLSLQQVDNIPGTGTSPSLAAAPTNLDLQALRDEYIALAEYTVPAGTYSNVSWGGWTDYTVVHVTGDLHASGSIEGGGILIVDGDFDCTGAFTWYGLVVVLGDINFSGGGNDVHIYGSVLSQGGIGSQVIGGNADILYSSAALARLAALTPYVVSSWREL